ncbi:MAG: hypothetical protein JOZ75_02540 [Candidatus Dormibacteraeota bacterium]|nr:hypothetical protein [Candidatus Dormibacteraeota bacterium]
MPQQRPSASKHPQPSSGNRRPPRSASRRKRERRREAELRRASGPSRPRWVWAGGAGAAVVVLALVLAIVLTRPHASSTGPRPTAAPTPLPSALASADSTANGSTVAGVSCDPTSPTATPAPSSTATPSAAPSPAFAHLAIYVNGEARRVPAGIGVGPPRTTQSTDAGPYVSGGCLYWLNTRTYDGVIHVQPPSQQTLTLGTFFDIWGQQLSATQVGPASGTVTVLVNGSPYPGDPRAVPLSSHVVIQLNVGTNVPFQHYDFPVGE